MKKLTILILILVPLVANAQDSTETIVQPVVPQPPETTISDEIFLVVEDMPEYPGGQEAMVAFINNNIEMPAEAEEVGAEGRVFVEFIIDTAGKMTNLRVIKDGVGFGCAKEALRVMNLMADQITWKPGKQRGRKVKVKYRCPITFKQEIKKKKKEINEESGGSAPKYPGGRTALDLKFWNEFILPGDIAALGIYGKIEIELFISKEGELLDAKILKDGVGFGLAEESLRAIKVVAAQEEWIPGKINGKNVDMRYIHIANIVPNQDYVYCAEPDNLPKSMLGDDELKQKILRKILKRYQLSPDESQQELIIDVMITASGNIEYIHITYNSFDNKLAMRARGALYPEQSRFIAATLDGVNVRARYRLVITRQDVEDYLNHIDHE